MVKVDAQWDNQWKKLFLGIFSVMKWVNLSEEQNVKFFSSMYNNESWNYVLDEIMLHYNLKFKYDVSNDMQKQFS